jgi:hypothetical protein
MMDFSTNLFNQKLINFEDLNSSNTIILRIPQDLINDLDLRSIFVFYGELDELKIIKNENSQNQ